MLTPLFYCFVKKLKNKQIIASMTVNQVHFMKYLNTINYLVDADLIKGLGISLVNPTDEFIKEVKQFPNAVIHIINGIVTMEQLKKLYDNNLKVLILGYKTVGRGKGYYSEEVEKNKQIIYDNIKKILNHFDVISFDNLALKQLEFERILTKRQWDEFYMGDDGQFTMYIDIPKMQFSRNSMSEVRYDLLDDIDDMFKVITGK